MNATVENKTVARFEVKEWGFKVVQFRSAFSLYADTGDAWEFIVCGASVEHCKAIAAKFYG